MKPTYQPITQSYALPADTNTPVGIYLKIRDRFPSSILLESADYRGSDNSFSYIACKPIAYFKAQGTQLDFAFPNEAAKSESVSTFQEVLPRFQAFVEAFGSGEEKGKSISNGLFGYTSYPAVQYFEQINLQQPDSLQIPELFYQAFRYVLAIDHFRHRMVLYVHRYGEEEIGEELDMLLSILRSKSIPEYPFELLGEESSNVSDAEYLDMVKQGKKHCQLGDVFQIVLSRRFEQAFLGDEFNVYRALRSVNPSPYLFYFDFGGFKILGSSPEAQLVVGDGKASIHPIAGTFRRTGDDTADAQLAAQLAEDPKENAEHVMLVDLARNDLSRHCEGVEVEEFRQIQYYSHVIHLVSKVSGHFQSENSLQIMADTFPAGTLSGAPKYKAMSLIDQYENCNRSFYGGAIGFIGFNGTYNHAIMIRSFLSKEGKLHYQAGAGVVAKSVEEKELQEVHNKLDGLRAALKVAQEVHEFSLKKP
ncbi:anthranilate synthase component I family protein [Cytophagales bacterium LB-30]|uniref:Anthranilate synthase component 1 n=1 Tax=Shiella aurantiaca TaxID=3058365 RepID=A0ABT8F7I3_9BACT|nr:anthranilate synthase component I family protein [Shiella aurantiaca]MDN4166441.1 anthranilate synthase component I family protein [Shiella aurantiaca]